MFPVIYFLTVCSVPRNNSCFVDFRAVPSLGMALAVGTGDGRLQNTDFHKCSPLSQQEEAPWVRSPIRFQGSPKPCPRASHWVPQRNTTTGNKEEFGGKPRPRVEVGERSIIIFLK